MENVNGVLKVNHFVIKKPQCTFQFEDEHVPQD